MAETTHFSALETTKQQSTTDSLTTTPSEVVTSDHVMLHTSSPARTEAMTSSESRQTNGFSSAEISSSYSTPVKYTDTTSNTMSTATSVESQHSSSEGTRQQSSQSSFVASGTPYKSEGSTATEPSTTEALLTSKIATTEHSTTIEITSTALKSTPFPSTEETTHFSASVTPNVQASTEKPTTAPQVQYTTESVTLDTSSHTSSTSTASPESSPTKESASTNLLQSHSTFKKITDTSFNAGSTYMSSEAQSSSSGKITGRTPESSFVTTETTVISGSSTITESSTLGEVLSSKMSSATVSTTIQTNNTVFNNTPLETMAETTNFSALETTKQQSTTDSLTTTPSEVVTSDHVILHTSSPARTEAMTSSESRQTNGFSSAEISSSYSTPVKYTDTTSNTMSTATSVESQHSSSEGTRQQSSQSSFVASGTPYKSDGSTATEPSTTEALLTSKIATTEHSTTIEITSTALKSTPFPSTEETTHFSASVTPNVQASTEKPTTAPQVQYTTESVTLDTSSHTSSTSTASPESSPTKESASTNLLQSHSTFEKITDTSFNAGSTYMSSEAQSSSSGKITGRTPESSFVTTETTVISGSSTITESSTLGEVLSSKMSSATVSTTIQTNNTVFNNTPLETMAETTHFSALETTKQQSTTDSLTTTPSEVVTSDHVMLHTSSPARTEAMTSSESRQTNGFSSAEISTSYSTPEKYTDTTSNTMSTATSVESQHSSSEGTRQQSSQSSFVASGTPYKSEGSTATEPSTTEALLTSKIATTEHSTAIEITSTALKSTPFPSTEETTHFSASVTPNVQASTEKPTTAPQVQYTTESVTLDTSSHTSSTSTASPESSPTKESASTNLLQSHSTFEKITDTSFNAGSTYMSSEAQSSSSGKITGRTPESSFVTTETTVISGSSTITESSTLGEVLSSKMSSATVSTTIQTNNTVFNNTPLETMAETTHFSALETTKQQSTTDSLTTTPSEVVTSDHVMLHTSSPARTEAMTSSESRQTNGFSSAEISSSYSTPVKYTDTTSNTMSTATSVESQHSSSEGTRQQSSQSSFLASGTPYKSDGSTATEPLTTEALLTSKIATTEHSTTIEITSTALKSTPFPSTEETIHFSASVTPNVQASTEKPTTAPQVQYTTESVTLDTSSHTSSTSTASPESSPTKESASTNLLQSHSTFEKITDTSFNAGSTYMSSEAQSSSSGKLTGRTPESSFVTTETTVKSGSSTITESSTLGEVLSSKMSSAIVSTTIQTNNTVFNSTPLETMAETTHFSGLETTKQQSTTNSLSTTPSEVVISDHVMLHTSSPARTEAMTSSESRQTNGFSSAEISSSYSTPVKYTDTTSNTMSTATSVESQHSSSEGTRQQSSQSYLVASGTPNKSEGPTATEPSTTEALLTSKIATTEHSTTIEISSTALKSTPFPSTEETTHFSASVTPKVQASTEKPTTTPQVQYTTESVTLDTSSHTSSTSTASPESSPTKESASTNLLQSHSTFEKITDTSFNAGSTYMSSEAQSSSSGKLTGRTPESSFVTTETTVKSGSSTITESSTLGEVLSSKMSSATVSTTIQTNNTVFNSTPLETMAETTHFSALETTKQKSTTDSLTTTPSEVVTSDHVMLHTSSPARTEAMTSSESRQTNGFSSAEISSSYSTPVKYTDTTSNTMSTATSVESQHSSSEGTRQHSSQSSFVASGTPYKSEGFTATEPSTTEALLTSKIATEHSTTIEITSTALKSTPFPSTEETTHFSASVTPKVQASTEKPTTTSQVQYTTESVTLDTSSHTSSTSTASSESSPTKESASTNLSQSHSTFEKITDTSFNAGSTYISSEAQSSPSGKVTGRTPESSFVTTETTVKSGSSTITESSTLGELLSSKMSSATVSTTIQTNNTVFNSTPLETMAETTHFSALETTKQQSTTDSLTTTPSEVVTSDHVMLHTSSLARTEAMTSSESRQTNGFSSAEISSSYSTPVKFTDTTSNTMSTATSVKSQHSSSEGTRQQSSQSSFVASGTPNKSEGLTATEPSTTEALLTSKIATTEHSTIIEISSTALKSTPFPSTEETTHFSASVTPKVQASTEKPTTTSQVQYTTESVTLDTSSHTSSTSTASSESSPTKESASTNLLQSHSTFEKITDTSFNAGYTYMSSEAQSSSSGKLTGRTPESSFVTTETTVKSGSSTITESSTLGEVLSSKMSSATVSTTIQANNTVFNSTPLETMAETTHFSALETTKQQFTTDSLTTTPSEVVTSDHVMLHTSSPARTPAMTSSESRQTNGFSSSVILSTYSTPVKYTDTTSNTMSTATSVESQHSSSEGTRQQSSQSSFVASGTPNKSEGPTATEPSTTEALLTSKIATTEHSTTIEISSTALKSTLFPSTEETTNFSASVTPKVQASTEKPTTTSQVQYTTVSVTLDSSSHTSSTSTASPESSPTKESASTNLLQSHSTFEKITDTSFNAGSTYISSEAQSSPSGKVTGRTPESYFVTTETTVKSGSSTITESSTLGELLSSKMSSATVSTTIQTNNTVFNSTPLETMAETPHFSALETTKQQSTTDSLTATPSEVVTSDHVMLHTSSPARTEAMTSSESRQTNGFSTAEISTSYSTPVKYTNTTSNTMSTATSFESQHSSSEGTRQQSSQSSLVASGTPYKSEGSTATEPSTTEALLTSKIVTTEHSTTIEISSTALKSTPFPSTEETTHFSASVTPNVQASTEKPTTAPQVQYTTESVTLDTSSHTSSTSTASPESSPTKESASTNLLQSHSTFEKITDTSFNAGSTYMSSEAQSSSSGKLTGRTPESSFVTTETIVKSGSATITESSTLGEVLSSKMSSATVSTIIQTNNTVFNSTPLETMAETTHFSALETTKQQSNTDSLTTTPSEVVTSDHVMLHTSSPASTPGITSSDLRQTNGFSSAEISSTYSTPVKFTDKTSNTMSTATSVESQHSSSEGTRQQLSQSSFVASGTPYKSEGPTATEPSTTEALLTEHSTTIEISGTVLKSTPFSSPAETTHFSASETPKVQALTEKQTTILKSYGTIGELTFASVQKSPPTYPLQTSEVQLSSGSSTGRKETTDHSETQTRTDNSRTEVQNSTEKIATTETTLFIRTTTTTSSTTTTTSSTTTSTTTDADDCASSPCKNQGTCIDGFHSFTCICPTNYQGTTCSDDVDECSQTSTKCDSNAVCTNTIGSYKCTCKDGYKGNGLTCEFGYSGRVCEIDIDDCKSSPCKNGAVCVDKVNAYACVCQNGWQGTNCSTDVDECSQGLSPCDKNALCLNTLGSYTCTCATGYKGDGFTCKEIRLFTYGPSVGDQKATKRAVDFVSPIINIPIGFPFDSAFYNNLYFTDNGVIAFQRNIYDPVYVLSYPYTTFQSNDPYTPPLIAAFWADADLSGGIGDIYYQFSEGEVPGKDKNCRQARGGSKIIKN
ncbi:platelet binding protein GspB-like [Dendropsophus ebraccatus]|uniref:platelet binding protein GspB-like n=1 Tax=Dendropsophus ebraccatus TaxID=150705 RepID=UPI003831419D